MPLVIFDVFYRSDSSRMFYVRKCARCVLLRFFLRQNFEGIATSRIASTGTLRNNTAQEKQGIYIPHLYSNPFAIHDDCLHFEVDACRYHKKIFCKIRKQSSHDWRHWVSVGYKIIRHKLRCCLYTNLSSIYVIC